MLEMDDFSDNSDVEILSQLPEEDLLNTVVEGEEAFAEVLEEIQKEEKKNWLNRTASTTAARWYVSEIILRDFSDQILVAWQGYLVMSSLLVV